MSIAFRLGTHRMAFFPKRGNEKARFGPNAGHVSGEMPFGAKGLILRDRPFAPKMGLRALERHLNAKALRPQSRPFAGEGPYCSKNFTKASTSRL